MAILFAGNAGRVVAVQDPATIGMISGVRLDGWGGFAAFRAIITRCQVSQQGNFQFLHTLGNQIYVYVFGDRVGQFRLMGLAFDSGCSGVGQPLGIEAVQAYYEANRLANRATPLQIAIGTGTPAQALLLGMNTEIVDPDARVFQFDMSFALIPPISSGSGRTRQGFGNGTGTTGTGPLTGDTGIPNNFTVVSSGGDTGESDLPDISPTELLPFLPGNETSPSQFFDLQT